MCKVNNPDELPALNEYDKDEGYDIYRVFRPDVTDEEFEAAHLASRSVN